MTIREILRNKINTASVTTRELWIRRRGWIWTNYRQGRGILMRWKGDRPKIDQGLKLGIYTIISIRA